MTSLSSARHRSCLLHRSVRTAATAGVLAVVGVSLSASAPAPQDAADPGAGTVAAGSSAVAAAAAGLLSGRAEVGASRSQARVVPADAGATAPAAVPAQADAQADAQAQADAAADARVQAAAAAAAAEQAAAQAEQAAAAARAAYDADVAAAVADPRAVAAAMAAMRGWGSAQFSCLDSLWTKESGWKYTAENRSSHAYGIPQSLPGAKMAGVADDWRTNPRTQIAWGLGYIASTYGTPCSAWSHSRSAGWY